MSAKGHFLSLSVSRTNSAYPTDRRPLGNSGLTVPLISSLLGLPEINIHPLLWFPFCIVLMQLPGIFSPPSPGLIVLLWRDRNLKEEIQRWNLPFLRKCLVRFTWLYWFFATSWRQINKQTLTQQRPTFLFYSPSALFPFSELLLLMHSFSFVSFFLFPKCCEYATIYIAVLFLLILRSASEVLLVCAKTGEIWRSTAEVMCLWNASFGRLGRVECHIGGNCFEAQDCCSLLHTYADFYKK